MHGSTKDVLKNKQSADTAEYISSIETESILLLNSVEQMKRELEAYYPRLVKEDLLQEASQKADSLKRTTSNLSRAARQMFDMKDELSARLTDVKQQRRKSIIGAVPANALIDAKEKEANHFARGLNIYKLLLVCFMGSFCGVVVEMLWCFISRGYLESRAGLVYGPFNLLYGFGAVLLTACLYPFRNRGAWISFAGSILLGSTLEYFCSWGQEFVFGSRSWDYSNMPLNINGRICLLYSVFWGLLGVLWIKNLYPRLAKLILKIPNHAGKILTWILTVFFIVNTAMSGIALTRWTQRNNGIAPANTFWETIDRRFPNSRMEKIYANMVFSAKTEN